MEYSFVLKEDNFVAGDIVLWDGEKKVVADPNMFSLPASGYTPIGVIVIPASHMDDGRARMMATRWMSCDDPENGSVEPEKMVWGTATELTGLTNFTEVPVIARYDNDDQGGVTALTNPQAIYTTNGYANLPSDNPAWTGEINPEDPITRWRQSTSYVGVNSFYAPSPYAKDGTPNPLYRAMSYSGGTINNALSYFDGRHQTDVILDVRGEKDYGTWKPTVNVPEDFPAASCCDMYHTVGTSQGDWYLPSAAELGYVAVREYSISNVMSKIGGIAGFFFYIWTSTPTNIDNCSREIYLNDGCVGIWGIRNSLSVPVVAFAIV